MAHDIRSCWRHMCRPASWPVERHVWWMVCFLFAQTVASLQPWPSSQWLGFIKIACAFMICSSFLLRAKNWIPKQRRAPPMRQVGGRFSIQKLLWWRRFFRQDLMQGCVCWGSTWIYQLGQLGACCNLPRVKNTFLDLARSVSFGWAFVAWDWHDIFCCIFVREQFER